MAGFFLDRTSYDTEKNDYYDFHSYLWFSTLKDTDFGPSLHSLQHLHDLLLFFLSPYAILVIRGSDR